jgi:hypothetical protein
MPLRKSVAGIAAAVLASWRLNPCIHLHTFLRIHLPGFEVEDSMPLLAVFKAQQAVSVFDRLSRSVITIYLPNLPTPNMTVPPPPYEKVKTGTAGDASIATEPVTHGLVKTLVKKKCSMCGGKPDCLREGLQNTRTPVAKSCARKMVREWDHEEMRVLSLWPTHCWEPNVSRPSSGRSNVLVSLLRRPSSNSRGEIPQSGLALEAGDHVFKPHDGSKWTQAWGWCVTWRLMACPPLVADSPWGVDVRIVAKQPPWQRVSGISFADSHMSQLYGNTRRLEDDLDPARGWHWMASYAFTSLEATPQIDRTWMAEVIVAHGDRAKLEALDWRSLLAAQNTAL